MASILSVLNFIVDALLYPFRPLPPFWGLLFISILAGLGMILIFSRFSNQPAIARLRKRMGGEVLGILLHVSRPGTVIAFALKLIWSNMLYLGHLLVPMAVMAVPFMLLWGQLDARYGARPLDPGEYRTVTLEFAGEMPSREDMDITAEGVELIPPVVMVDEINEASFRILQYEEGSGQLMAGSTAVEFGRSYEGSGAVVFRGFRGSPGIWSLFTPMYQVRTADPDLSGRWSMPGTDYSVLGGHWSWIAVFLVFSMVSAVAGAKIMKIKV